MDAPLAPPTSPPPIVVSIRKKVEVDVDVDLTKTIKWIHAAGNTQTGRRAAMAIIMILQFIKVLAVIHNQFNGRDGVSEKSIDVDVTIDDKMIGHFKRFATSPTRPPEVPVTNPATRFVLFKKLHGVIVTLYNAYAEDIAASLQREYVVALDGMLDWMDESSSDTHSAYNFFKQRSGKTPDQIREETKAKQEQAKRYAEIAPVKSALQRAMNNSKDPPTQKYLDVEHITNPFRGKSVDNFISSKDEEFKLFEPFIKNPNAIATEWKPLVAYNTLIADISSMETELTTFYSSYLTDKPDWKISSNIYQVLTPVIEKFESKLNEIKTENFKCDDGTGTNKTRCDAIDAHIRFYKEIIKQPNPFPSDRSPMAVFNSNLKDTLMMRSRDIKLNVLDTDTGYKAVEKLIAYHIDYVDSLIPVRTVVNFRTKYGNEQDDANASNNFRNIFDPAIAPETDISLYSSAENEERIRFKTLINDGTKYGPFYRVINGGTGLNVKEDIQRLLDYYKKNGAGPNFVPKHYTYSAFGYSGSGKSFSLLTNPDKNGIFNRIIQTIVEHGERSGDDYDIEIMAYDYYGEIADEGCLGVSEKEPERCDLVGRKPVEQDITFFKIAKNQSELICSHNQSDLIQLSDATDIKAEFETRSNGYKVSLKSLKDGSDTLQDVSVKYVNALIEYRAKTNFAQSPTDSQKYHIRMTPNNDESSRAHLFIDIYIRDNANRNVGKVTVMDMAGSEKVSTIQLDYFEVEEMPTYDDQKIVPQIENLYKEVMITFVDSLRKFKTVEDYTTTGNKNTGYTENTYKIINKSLTSSPDIANAITKKINGISFNLPVTEEKTFIVGKTNNWLRLYESLKPNLTETQRDLLIKFICFNNVFMMNLLLLKFDNVLFYLNRTEKIKSGSNNLSVNLTDDYFKTSKKYGVTLNADKSIAIIPENQIEKEGVIKYFDIFKDYLDALKIDYNKNSSTFTSDAIQSIHKINAKAVTEMTKVQNQKSGAINRFNVIVKNFNDTNDGFKIEFDETIQRYNVQIDTSKLPESVRKDIDAVKGYSSADYDADLYKFKTEVIRKIHCPIRYQGNFINKTLNDLQHYANELANPSPSSDQRMTSILKQIMTNNIYKNPMDHKFVLMTNIRLDFDKLNEISAKKRNYITALTDSLTFAHCLNPFSTKSADGFETCKALTLCPSVKTLNAFEEPSIQKPVARPALTGTFKIPETSKTPGAERIAPTQSTSSSKSYKDALLKTPAQSTSTTPKKTAVSVVPAKSASSASTKKASSVASDKSTSSSTRYRDALLKPAPPVIKPAQTTINRTPAIPGRRRGGAPDAPDIVSDVLLATGSLLIVFAAALGFGERALTTTPDPSAKVRAATFLAFYTLFALLWAAMGLVGARTFVLHLLIVYAIVGIAAEFAPQMVKKKSSGVFAAAFVVAVVGLVVSAAAGAAPT